MRSTDNNKSVNTLQTLRTEADAALFSAPDDDDEEVPKPKKKMTAKSVSLERVNKEGTPTITVPEGMDLEEAARWLSTLANEDKREIEFSHTFEGWYPMDAIWALYQAVAELHGFSRIADYAPWAKASSISVQTGVNEHQQIPWGLIEVSGFANKFCPHVEMGEDGNQALFFHGAIRNKDKPKADRIVAKTYEILKERSIYKGKAIEISFEEIQSRGHGASISAKSPTFIDVKTGMDELVFSDKVQRLLDVNLFAPIRNSRACRQKQVPLRRTNLLSGGYGVGKSMTARAVAAECVKNGWTFILIKDLTHLQKALYFAKKYQPAVVFGEDINRVTDGQRDAKMDDLLNTVDGIDRKNDEVMIIFTTNNPEDIHPGMLRPGRIDAIINVEAPDAQATERLIRQYGRGLVDESADLTKTAKMLAGQIPAIVREAVERSKLASIADLPRDLTEEEMDVAIANLKVRSEHLEIAAVQCLEHSRLLEKKPVTEEENFSHVFKVLGNGIGRAIAMGAYDEGGRVFDPEGDSNLVSDKHDYDEVYMGNYRPVIRTFLQELFNHHKLTATAGTNGHSNTNGHSKEVEQT